MGMPLSRLRALAGGCLVASALWGQSNGEIGLGVVWQTVDGSRDSYQSQYRLGSGLFLAGLSLDLRPWWEGFSRLQLEASGFGAEPDRRLGFSAAWDKEWRLDLSYKRRERFFFSPDWDLGARRDAWALERWYGRLTYDGFSRVRLHLNVRDVRKDGTITGPFYGLGRPYSAQRRVSEELREAFFSLESKGLPVVFVAEQGVSHRLARTRLRPAEGGSAADGSDPDRLAGVRDPGEDKSTSPVTRMAAAFQNARWEVSVDGLYRRGQSASHTLRSEVYSLGDSRWGTAEYRDDLRGHWEGSVQKAGARVGLHLGGGFSLRLRADSEKRETDTWLAGYRTLILSGPGGTVELPMPLEDFGFFDVRDRLAVVEARWQGQGVGATAFRKLGNRKVQWRLSQDAQVQGPERDAEGWGLVASWNFRQKISGEAGGEVGTFEHYVLRVEPNETRRGWLKLRYKPTENLGFGVSVAGEEGENPRSAAALDYRSQDFSFSATLHSAAGGWLDVAFSELRISSDTNISFFAPVRVAGVSSYRLAARTASVRGAWPLSGRLQVEGGAVFVRDRQGTFPFTSHSADLQLSWEYSPALEWSVFATAQAFDAKASDTQDFEARRFGVICRWRF